MKTIKECIGTNPYPGRGVIIGTAADGRAVIGYFISGRSQNSRNRILPPMKEEIFLPGLSTNPKSKTQA